MSSTSPDSLPNGTRTAITVAIESPAQAEVQALIAALDAYQDTLYPPESRHVLDLTGLLQAHVTVLVARDQAGQALGCVALVRQPDHGEVKRLYVIPAARRHGVARALLTRLVDLAVTQGCPVLSLETGPRQPEALAFYARQGFIPGPPFGAYRADPLSVFLHKRLDPSV
ncbi:MAG TPA: GNAT family N-acetyltransferase [Aquabacterium sp.]|nr:GNAT family N-acetyltransferase [Aquabacterium sp.]